MYINRFPVIRNYLALSHCGCSLGFQRLLLNTRGTGTKIWACFHETKWIPT